MKEEHKCCQYEQEEFPILLATSWLLGNIASIAATSIFALQSVDHILLISVCPLPGRNACQAAAPFILSLYRRPLLLVPSNAMQP
jgi:hypothetical protein